MRQKAIELYGGLVAALRTRESSSDVVISESRIEDGPAVSARSLAVGGDTVTIWLVDEAIMVDVNESEAIDFYADDPRDESFLFATVKAFCERTLELRVGRDDDRCYGWRHGGEEVGVSEPLFRLRRSAPRIWRKVR